MGPVAEGERRRWADLPDGLKRALEHHLGARVLRAASEPGGFSPGVASRLALSDGRRVFAKVVSGDPNPDSPDIHRAEARIVTQLPPHAPVPRLLSAYDDGGRVAIFFELVEAHTPRLPWRPRELRRVVHAIESLVALLTPAPMEVPTFGARHRRLFSGWRELAAAHARGSDSLADLDPWVRDHLPSLADLESRFDRASLGKTLLHSDIRADNILVTKHRIYFVDWPWACIGPAWADLLFFLPSAAMQGGPRPWTVFDGSPLSRGANPEDVTSVLASLTGFLLGNSRKPAPPGLSTLRPFQRAQGVEALAWLRHRLRED